MSFKSRTPMDATISGNEIEDTRYLDLQTNDISNSNGE